MAHPRFFRRRRSTAGHQAEHNVDTEFLALMSELNEAVDGLHTRTQLLPEQSACARRGALLQVQAAVAMLVLPGLARRMQQSRGWRTPAQMKSLLAGVYLAQEINSHGRAAVVLDFFIRTFVHAPPREPPQSGADTIKVETLRHLVREGKIAQSNSAGAHHVRRRGSKPADTSETDEGADRADGARHVPEASAGRGRHPDPRGPAAAGLEDRGSRAARRHWRSAARPLAAGQCNFGGTH